MNMSAHVFLVQHGVFNIKLILFLVSFFFFYFCNGRSFYPLTASNTTKLYTQAHYGIMAQRKELNAAPIQEKNTLADVTEGTDFFFVTKSSYAA